MTIWWKVIWQVQVKIFHIFRLASSGKYFLIVYFGSKLTCFIIDFHKPLGFAFVYQQLQGYPEMLCFKCSVLRGWKCSLILLVIKFEFAFWKKNSWWVLGIMIVASLQFIFTIYLWLSSIVCHKMTHVIGMLFHYHSTIAYVPSTCHWFVVQDIRLGLYSEIASAMLSHGRRYSGGIRHGQSDPWQCVNTSDLAISLPSRGKQGISILRLT